MWPWGHAAVGYLLYSGWQRIRHSQSPTGPATVALGFGTQLPDLIDKPLSWSFGVLPTGRSLGHSWLIALPILVVLWKLVSPERRRLVVALGIGWLSHGLADSIMSIINWELAYLGFYLWPLTTTPPYSTEPSFAAHFFGIELTPFFLLQLPLAALALIVWYRDGCPGPGTLKRLYGQYSRD